jgi:predicted  nucleic acid-binding Zn-ribbon protein
MSRLTPLISIILLLVGIASIGVAQERSQPDGTLQRLLGEVHQLRVAIERQASIGARVQLLSSRVALQDDRVYKLLQQLENVRREIMGLETQVKQTGERDAHLEEALASETDPKRREELEDAKKQFKAERALQTDMLGALRTRESDLANAAATEQAKLDEVTRRLDDLERSLSVPQ